jgi:hypothetical protein
MKFGVESAAPVQNIYVRGTGGTGRLTLVQSLLDEIMPKFKRRLDRCYVHNFRQADRPTLITLEAGMGPDFRKNMKELAGFIEHRLQEVLESEPLAARRELIAKSTQEEIAEVLTGIEAGEPDENGAWPESSVVGIAQRQASEFWHKSHGTPSSRNDTRSDD